MNFRADKRIFKLCGYQSIPPWDSTGRTEEYIKRITKPYDFPRFHITRSRGQDHYEIHIDLRKLHHSWLKGTIKDNGHEVGVELKRLRIKLKETRKIFYN